MAFNTTTVARIVELLNRKYFLPAIQRPYVWEPTQVIALFDSLMRGYPFGSFLFWELQPENRNNWDIYKFIEDFRYGETSSELVAPNGHEISLVLDGQQRLTSMLIGLRGSYTVRAKHKRRSNPDAWIRTQLYIDLLKEPEDEEDDDLGVGFGFAFLKDQPQNSDTAFWVKVGALLAFPDERDFNRFKDELWDKAPETLTRRHERIFHRNIDRLWRALWHDESISYYSEKSQSYDRVLNIFVRANSGGTQLSKSDLLLSTITSRWAGINAREEIFGFVNYINNGLDRKNDLDKDFVMRACLVLTDLDHAYKVSNFTRENLALIEQNWQLIKEAIEATIRLVNRFGIDRDTLTSTNALLPIAYYAAKIGPGRLLDSTPFAARNAARIHRWLLGALLNNVFGGASVTTTGLARSLVRQGLSMSEDFPSDLLADGLRKRGRITNLGGESVEALLDTRYGSRTCFLALSTLYEERNWGTQVFHIDHIIPRATFNKAKLERAGIPPKEASEIADAGERLGNLQLLTQKENLEKSSRPFSDWIDTRDADFLRRHLIPNQPSLWSPARLIEFVNAREELIRAHLANTFSDAPRTTFEAAAD